MQDSLRPTELFGMRVRELRVARQVTQEELADRVGVFRTYMSRVETGAANPTLTVIHAVADALGVPVQELFAVPTQSRAKARSSKGASRGRVTGS